MMPQEQAAAEFEPVFELCPDYQSLQRALRSRAEKLQVTRSAIDEASGAPAGYAGKTLAEKYVRRFSQSSIYEVLTVLGLSLIVVDTREAIERSQGILKRFNKRDESQVRLGNRSAKTGKEAKEASRTKPRSAKKRAA